MTATETIDAEVILKEILEVFEKYSVPVNTVEVDFSLLDQDFDLMFPHLREYKSGIFYKSLVIDGKPATLRAGRRYPFDELVKWFEQHVLPLAQDIATDIQREFQDVIAQVRVTHHENETGRNGVEYYYRISVTCRRRGMPMIEERNSVELSVGLRQFDATSYPTIYGYVGWLVDKESGNDWAIETVADLFPSNNKVELHGLDYLKRSLPSLRQYLWRELEEHLQS